MKYLELSSTSFTHVFMFQTSPPSFLLFASHLICRFIHFQCLMLCFGLALSLHFVIKIQSIEIQKRVGAFSMALDTINKCLSEAICALSRGRLDGESRTAGLVHSGNEILETYRYYPEVRLFQY